MVIKQDNYETCIYGNCDYCYMYNICILLDLSQPDGLEKMLFEPVLVEGPSLDKNMHARIINLKERNLNEYYE